MDYKVTIGSGKKAVTRAIQIERVPYKVFIIAQKVEKKRSSVMDLANNIAELEKEITELKVDKPDGWLEALADKKNAVKDMTAEIYAVEDTGFFEERFEAIKLILSVNDIREDDELMNPKTWSDKMDYSDPMNFIEACCNKDTDKKKVLKEMLASLTKKD